MKEVIDDLFDNAEAMSDPDPEQFNIQFLQMSGNPIQHIPMVAQDGEKIAPNIAIVLAMEGTLVKRVHDVRLARLLPYPPHPHSTYRFLRSASMASATSNGQRWRP